MSLAAGVKLGPYEILGALGSGGMGDVLRARDARLGRDVAVKVLPVSVAENQERLRRFELEARAAGILNHPNLLAVYDVGTHEGLPYIVSELLEGDTLRALLRGGPLPLRKAVEYGAQICRGLAAAHDKGIVHRDLKPENVLVTRDGRVKILDFGLAKPVAGSPMLHEDATTGNMGTSPGVVLGTVGYLSPEQVRGLPVDHRSDVFSFGAVFYEMLTSRRAFKRDNPVETMTAILRDEPPPITEADGVPPVLALILRRCLEKTPEQRFQSAQDLAFDLDSMVTQTGRAAVLPLEPVRRRSKTLGVAAAATALLAAGAVVGHLIWKTPAPPPPTFKQLTFRRGYVGTARFAPDGHTIVYSASWQGEPMEVFSTRPEGPESRSLGYKQTELLAVSATGEMAISLRRRSWAGLSRIGTLARVPFGGGAPREVAEDVEWADWSPDGAELAVVRTVDRRDRLEFPIGRVVYETGGWISALRIAPHGDAVAFVEHSAKGGLDGTVTLVDRAGRKTTLSHEPVQIQGLAWHGSDVWVTAAKTGGHRALYALSPTGVERLVTRVAGALTLEDISADGKVLVTHGTERGGIIGLPPGETRERDLSWLDRSVVRDLSPDGRVFLFHEYGEGSGRPTTYLGRTDGSPAIRLGPGISGALSPDGRWAISVVDEPARRLALLPTGVGEPREILLGDVECDEAWWFPDGEHLLVVGSLPGRRSQGFVIGLKKPGDLRAFTREGFFAFGNPISPDGKFVAMFGLDRQLVLYPIDGSPPRPVPGAEKGDQPLRWTADGRGLFALQRDGVVSEIFRLDLSTGRREAWKELSPIDPAGIIAVGSQLLTPDGRSYVYSYVRMLSDLFLVEHLK